jgi:hypothetical protein
MRPCGRVHKRGHVGGYANAAMWAGTQVQPCDQVHNHRVGQKRHYSMLKLSACSQRTLQGWQALTKVRYTNGVHGANRVWQTLWSGTQGGAWCKQSMANIMVRYTKGVHGANRVRASTQRGCMVQTEYGQVHKYRENRRDVLELATC